MTQPSNIAGAPSWVWDGESRVVIGIDIGTTQSGVAFAFLETGSGRTIHQVTQWPGQEARNLQSKVPSLVWYDRNNKAVSFGAEALLPQTEEKAEDEEWKLVKHFKLHLHPVKSRSKYRINLEGLPPGISLQQIYADFFGYLLHHTQGYFQDRIVDGKYLWQKYRPTMQFIIAHPNGWAAREQKFLRDAAIKAGFTTDTTARTNIRFVTEAEASVHFCIHHTNLGSRLQPGAKFAVCDAGGSTVDTTVYSVVAADPSLKLKEARAPACVQAGAIFVNTAAEEHIRKTLESTDLDEEDVNDYTKRGVDDFEKTLKRNFRDATEDKGIEIAGPRFNNPAMRTRRGRMTLEGPVIKTFFDICVDQIKSSIDQQIEGLSISHILLVGGFGDSPYLQQEFKQRYEPRGCQITLTNDSTSKAVANGAIIWSVMSSVEHSGLSCSLGFETSVCFDSTSPEHRGRRTVGSLPGKDVIHGRWTQVIAKGVTSDAEATRQPVSLMFPSQSSGLGVFELKLLSYSGDDEPTWTRDENGALLEEFEFVCIFASNLTGLRGALSPRVGAYGIMHWQLDFQICIHFDGDELAAHLEWEEEVQFTSLTKI